MIAKKRAVVILSAAALCLAVLAGLLAAYTPGGGAAGEEEAVYTITDIPVSEVSAVALTNQKTTFGVLVKEGELEVVSDVRGDYSLSELRSLVYAASHLTGSRKITDLENGSQYGMDAPQANLSVIRKDGKQVDLAVLSENPLDGNYYIYSDADKAVYLIPPAVAELFLREESDFFSHTVFPVINTANYEKLASVALDFNGKGRDYKIVGRDGGFYLETPIVQKIPAASLLQKLLIPISALYSDGLASPDGGLEGLGFGDYTVKITVEFDGETYQGLLLDQGGGKCLMANADTGAVYQLSGTDLSPLLADYVSLLDGRVFGYAAGDVKSIAASGEGLDFFAELSGTEADAALVSALNGAEITGEVEEVPGGTPALTVTVTLRSGSIQTVELISAGRETYYVRVNGTANFTTSESYLRSLKQAFSDYQ